MKRTYLAAAVSVAPFLAMLAGQADGQVSISTATTTPVATATVSAGGPANIDVTSGGSIAPTAPAAAITLNSNNTVKVEGSLSFSGVDNATGILVQGGNTGQVTTAGSITVSESYAPTDTNNDGLVDGAFAVGGNRFGIAVQGGAPFVGGITTTGPITVHGNGSAGIVLGAPITGDLQMLAVTPATSTVAASIASGSITILGDHSYGLLVAPAGGIGGAARIGTVSATGVGTQGVVINGSVGGGVDFFGSVTATGYRSISRGSTPTLEALYTAREMQQGGAAVTIGGNVVKGVLISARPLVLSTTDLDLDKNGVPDLVQGIGRLSSYGAAPALQIGAPGLSTTLGVVGPAGKAYGLVIQGNVLGDGVFDQITTPNLPAAVSATAIQMGATGGGPVVVQGGVHNTGLIQAQAYQADATAIHIQSGVATPTILNDAAILSSTTQVNQALTGVTPLNVYGILIEKGASVPAIVNNAGLTANITGSAGIGGAAGAIIDRSGTLVSVTNTGTISAQVTQTLDSALLPATLTAINMSKSSAPQALTQGLSATLPAFTAYDATVSYGAGSVVNEDGVIYQALTASGVAVDPASNPSAWRQIGATAPAINGSVYFGSGGATVNVTAGTIAGATIDLGAGVNSLTVNGLAARVSGAIKDEGVNTLTLNILNGTLSDTNPNVIQAKSVNVGAKGLLLISADPVANTNTRFVTTGASVFADGAQIGLTLKSVQSAQTRTYVVVQTVPGSGTLTTGVFGAGVLTNAPFLYTAAPSVLVAADPSVGSSEVLLTVQRKSVAQLGFNAAEGAALDAVLAAIPNNAGIQSAILGQTTQAGLKSIYDQLLPNQGQGLFEALDAAAQSVSSLTATPPDAGTRVAGSSLWLQEVNERVHRSGDVTDGSNSKILGLVGGFERMGPGGGAAGLTLAYFNAEEAANGAQVGSNVIASLVEGGGYYRRSVGGLTTSARAAAGYAWFSGVRKFLAPGVYDNATSNWGGFFLDGHVSVAYEQRLGRFYVRPELSADYLRLAESAHGETGGGSGFDLRVASRTSSRLSGKALMVFGMQWGKTSWLRTEVRGGYREIFSGSVGDTLANFDGGAPFTLAADRGKGGWTTVGLSIKSGSEYSYIALEGDTDFRAGERRYDVRFAGRSMF